MDYSVLFFTHRLYARGSTKNGGLFRELGARRRRTELAGPTPSVSTFNLHLTPRTLPVRTARRMYVQNPEHYPSARRARPPNKNRYHLLSHNIRSVRRKNTWDISSPRPKFWTRICTYVRTSPAQTTFSPTEVYFLFFASNKGNLTSKSHTRWLQFCAIHSVCTDPIHG